MKSDRKCGIGPTPPFLEKLTKIIKIIISESTEIKGSSIRKMLSEILDNNRALPKGVGKYY